MSNVPLGDGTGGGHKLTRLGHDGRRHLRHEATLPCRLLFTRVGLRGAGTMLAVTRNLSRSGALLMLQHPLAGVRYVNVDFGGAAPLASTVRQCRGSDLAIEFFTPLTEAALTALLAGANGR